MIKENKSILFVSASLRLFKSFLLAIILLSVTFNSAKAWDIWLVTNQNRIIVIRNVETLPTQEYILTHAPAPDGYFSQFGDIGFAPDGSLYGISMTWGTGSSLYAIDLNNGSITPSGNLFPFEWGNALAFEYSTGRGYTGGGLEDSSPYEYLKRLRYFDNYDPGTTQTWLDMSGDYPNGGFAGDYAIANGHFYAIWGISNSANVYEHYLLQITVDANGNVISYINLGQSEIAIGEGIWGLASDGQFLYATSPTALYSITIVGNTATYTKIMDYQLNPGEEINGATSQWTDLSVTHIANNLSPILDSNLVLTTTVRNEGTYDANSVIAEVSLPTGYEYVQSNPEVGVYDPNSGLWSIGTLALGTAVTLEITVTVREVGSLESSAEITHSGQGDFDSNVRTSFSTDDLSDGHADDDEASAIVNSVISVPEILPATGFQRGAITDISYQPPAKAYNKTSLILEIPSLNVNAPIVGVPQSGEGWDTNWLGSNAGYLNGSAFPTWAGNTVITGHVWDALNQPGLFSDLKTLHYGDQIHIKAWGLTYTYEVRESKIIAPKNVSSVLQSEEYDWLTLVTCEFYNPFNGQYLFRRAVRAVLVDVR